MNLIERAKAIVLTPKTEWQVIAPETTTTADLYKSYIAPLALIGPVAGFIGFSFIGMGFRTPILWGFSQMIVSYVLGLVGVFIISLIVNGFAPTFGGEKSPMQALKVVGYAFTPAWIAGILNLFPPLAILGILAGLYSLYVLYLGLPVLMKAPQDKAIGYTAVVVICAIVLMFVISTIAASVGLMGVGAGRLASSGIGVSSLASRSGSGAGSDQINQMSAQIQAASQQMAAAQKSGDTGAQVAAATSALAAVTGGGTHVDPVDQSVLKALLPDTLGGLPRTSIEASKGGIGVLQVAKAEAQYANGQGTSIDLTITDMGGTQMLAAVAAWSMVEEDKETPTGYEKMGKVDGRPVHEVFDKNGPHGNYDTVIAGRFMVQASGSKVEMDALKQAVAGLDLAKLESMKNDGVKSTN